MLGKRVLVIEDDRDSLHVICELLRKAGHEVQTAQTAREGLRLLQLEPPPELVLLDYSLSDMTGPALLSMRARWPGAASVPAVLIGGDGSGSDGVGADLGRLGVVGVVRKPIDADELLERVSIPLPIRAPAAVASTFGQETDTAVAAGAARQVKRLSELLVRTSQVLAQGTDIHTQLRDVARSIVPTNAAACVIEQVDTAKALRDVLWTQHESPALDADLRAWARQPSWLVNVLTEVAERAEPRLLWLQTEADFIALGGSRADVATARALGFESVVVVPMVARRRLYGILTCATRAACRYGRNQLDAFAELGHRLALALDNAELISTAQQLRSDCDEVVSALATYMHAPLAAIVEAAGSTESSEGERWRTAVLREARRAQDTLSDLHDFAQLKAGQLQFRAHDLDLGALVRRVADEARRFSPGLDLRVSVAPEVVGVQVHGDPERLAQVLRLQLRAAGNAGQVEITLSRVEQTLQWTVLDAGPPLSREVIAHLCSSASYEPAEHTSGAHAAQQSPLPLRLARALLEAQGARFWVQASGDGLGNALHASFSVDEETAPDPQQVVAGASILLVDSDVAFRRELQEILSERGYQVESADNGLQAWQYLLANQAPELILFDLNLPSMDGWELHAAIKGHPKLHRVPTVVVSGLDRYRIEASLPDAQGYIEKPIRTAQLFEVVQRYVTVPARPRTLSVRPGSCL